MTKLIFLLLLFGFSSFSFATIKVNFYYEEQELKPYYMGTGSVPPEDKPGIFIELLKQVDHNLKVISIQFHRRPWKRCLHKLKTNQADAIIASFKQERDTIGVYPKKNQQVDKSQALSNARYCLFTHTESPLYWTGKAFRNTTDKPLAVPQGYSVLSFLRSHSIPVVTTNSTTSALDLLLKDKAEGIVTFCETGQLLLQYQYPSAENIYAQLPALQERTAYLVFSEKFYQDYPQLAHRIWKEIKQVRNKHFGKILERYEQ
ncbi:MAG: substrate-binding periplasmic protein [Aestuariibacter sp.]